MAGVHAQGIVQGGIQTKSVLLVRGGDAGFTVKVMDFGLAQLFTREIDLGTMSVISDPAASNRKRAWMAPEQTQPGASVGPLTDVWALGLIAFRVLTGASY